MRKLLSLLILLYIVSGLYGQEYSLENLGPNINDSKLCDCYPYISPDARTIYFSRKFDKKLKYEIMYSTLQSNGEWSKAQLISSLNNSNNNYVYNVSADGNSLILFGTYGSNPKEGGFSITHKTENGWSKPEKIPFERSEEMIGDVSATISANGKIMITDFNSDLQVSFLKTNGDWSFPIKLPRNINTDMNEYTPFLGSDDKTLYFSSGGHGGLGENDIYKITRLSETWMKWSNPENMGTTINSSDWESFFSISAKGDYAFVYSLKEGNGDLFRVKLEKKLQPQSVVLVRGKVYDQSTKKVISANISYELLPKGEKVGSASTNPKTGEYQIILKYGNNYGFSAQAEGYFSISENIELKDAKQYQEIEKDLFLAPIIIGVSIRLNNVFFDVNQSILRIESYPEIDRVVKLLKENKSMEIIINGHTDNVGSAEANLKLSSDRANSVMNYIISKGITSSRIQSKGYGKSVPIGTNDTEEGRQINRRVEFSITKK